MKKNMDIYVPAYFPAFTCIAGACKHSCCVGWEIDIDKESAARYRAVSGIFGEKLRQNMTETDEAVHFALSADGRCPFLTKENLCEIYKELGEDALCQICTDHPRYRNFYSFGIEMGLGLCCEAAARLILAETAPPRYMLLSGNGEAKPTAVEERFFALRASLLNIAFDATRCPEERRDEILRQYHLKLPTDGVYELYRGLAILHKSWETKLLRLKSVKAPTHFRAFPQLFSYFLCRHFSGGLEDGGLTARLLFALHAADVILRLAPTEEAVVAVARAYAEEIEYAEENMETILDFLSR